MKILVTGATGFIGRRLTNQLLSEGHEVYALVRPQSLSKASAIFANKSNIHLIAGDVSNTDVLEHVSGVKSLPEDIEAVLHLAALYDLEVGLADAYANNVVGTQNVIYLCQRMKNLKFFHHVSTYAVSGLHNGAFEEEQLEPQGNFPDFYARTKMQAEYLVRNAFLKNVKIRIYRPGIVVGDSMSGEMDKVDGPYYVFRFLSLLTKHRKKIPLNIFPLSCHAATTLPFLPVDTLVSWLSHMVTHPTDEILRSYHLVPDEKIFVTEFFQQSLNLYGLNMQVQKIPFPELYGKLLPLLKIPQQLMPYMQSRTSYQKTQLKKDFPQLRELRFSEYFPRLVSAAQGMFP